MAKAEATVEEGVWGAAELIRELERTPAEEYVGQREGPFRTCD